MEVHTITITTQRNDNVETTFNFFFLIWWMIKTLTSIDSQSESDCKELEYLKRQTIKLQCMLIINITLPCLGVDANIVNVTVVFMVIDLGVNGTIHRYIQNKCLPFRILLHYSVPFSSISSESSVFTRDTVHYKFMNDVLHKLKKSLSLNL